ncbi:hypothetical protein U9M48_015542 [Paspalum notatum var. saurae]|uniref:Uncharacterized protein n=1 Tax=Paspalum notatum var. saurae TaxID=547442 RepID=A0AAQ3T4E5_PASNO
MDGNDHSCDYKKPNHEQDEQDIGPLAPPPHNTKCEGVDQQQDPCIEHQPKGGICHLQKRPSPNDGLADRSPNRTDVHGDHHYRGDQQRRPLHYVHLSKLLIHGACSLFRELFVADPVQQREACPLDLNHTDEFRHYYDDDEVQHICGEWLLYVELATEDPYDGEEEIENKEDG